MRSAKAMGFVVEALEFEYVYVKHCMTSGLVRVPLMTSGLVRVPLYDVMVQLYDVRPGQGSTVTSGLVRVPLHDVMFGQGSTI